MSNINKRNQKSATDYVNSLFDNYSKLQAIRIDLAYKKEVANDIQLQDIKDDIRHLLNNRRSNHGLFSNCVGYIWKLENGREKGLHAHTMFLFDGSKVQKDIYLAKELGDYWVETVTGDRGLYYNCNAQKSEYEKCGIGKICHNDEEMRSNLVNEVLPYLTKDEQSIKSVKTGHETSFGKGIPGIKKSNAGRKRN
jgi:hypothetical protein